MMIIGRAAREPYRVIINPEYASPIRSILCPGRIDNTVSSFGAPKKMLGI